MVTDFPLRLLNAVGSEHGMRRQIQVTLESAQLDRGELVLRGEVQNLLPLPLGTPSVEKAKGSRFSFVSPRIKGARTAAETIFTNSRRLRMIPESVFPELPYGLAARSVLLHLES